MIIVVLFNPGHSMILCTRLGWPRFPSNLASLYASRNGTSTASLGSVFQCLTTLFYLLFLPSSQDCASQASSAGLHMRAAPAL